MSSFFNPQNPGIDGLVGLTSEEAAWLQAGTAGVLNLAYTTAPPQTSNVGKVYVKSSDGELYYKDGDGNEEQISGVGVSGANTALSNLASVAINTSLISDTDVTDDLGSSSIKWNNLFVANIGATGTRVTKGWFTDLQVTNAIAGSITGNAATVTGFTPASGSLTLAGADALTLTTTDATNVTLPTTGTLATLAGSEVFSSKTLTAPIINASTITGNQNIAALPASDHTANGPTTNAIASGYTASAFDLVFLGSGGKWLEVDADAVATCKGLIGLALEAKNDTEAMLVALPGCFVRDDSWAWTVGATLYAGETLGAMQETIPTGADAVIRVVGFAVSADVILFQPSSDQQTTVA